MDSNLKRPGRPGGEQIKAINRLLGRILPIGHYKYSFTKAGEQEVSQRLPKNNPV